MRLKEIIRCVETHSPTYFNSKVVRLKGKASVRMVELVKFQFQSGAVKRALYQLGYDGFCLFQFQSGAVKRLCGLKKRLLVLYFNSKVVRLKETSVRSKTPLGRRFQFQSGAVKSMMDFALKNLKTISIPKWCG